VLFSADYRAEFSDIFARRRPPADPTIYVSCSAVDDSGAATSGHENLVLLVNVPAGNLDQWDDLADDYRDHVLERLAARGLDLRGRIVFSQTLTPQDLQRRYHGWQGSIYGSSHNGRLAPLRRPANRGPLAGLYLAGGSAHPGGGLPLVLIGSRIVAGLVDADLREGRLR
jgi:phytoene dehydrogenase-like protein